jgi:DNA-binding transcriptional MerR regulator
MAKSAGAFRTISEAADELGLAQHVLRFWETRFTFVRPMKRAGGRRFYRPSDIQVLAAVRRLLHQEGYTIKGVQKLYRDHGLKAFVDGASEAPMTEIQRPHESDRLAGALSDLERAKARLDKLLGRH